MIHQIHQTLVNYSHQSFISSRYPNISVTEQIPILLESALNVAYTTFVYHTHSTILSQDKVFTNLFHKVWKYKIVNFLLIHVILVQWIKEWVWYVTLSNEQYMDTDNWPLHSSSSFWMSYCLRILNLSALSCWTSNTFLCKSSIIGTLWVEEWH